MDIFYLAYDVNTNAKAHCDKHVCKMIIEYAQLLSTAHYVLDGKQVGYKPTHKNHPCAVWVRQGHGNYTYLLRLLQALCLEYTVRYGKIHKTQGLLPELETLPINIPFKLFFDPPQCLPEDCKCDNVVDAYRKYYVNYKSSFAKWKHGAPVWWPLKEI